MLIILKYLLFTIDFLAWIVTFAWVPFIIHKIKVFIAVVAVCLFVCSRPFLFVCFSLCRAF